MNILITNYNRDLYSFINSLARNEYQERIRVRRGSTVETAEINIWNGSIQRRKAFQLADGGLGRNNRSIDRRVAESSIGESVLLPRIYNREQWRLACDGERVRCTLRGIATSQNACEAGGRLIVNFVKTSLRLSIVAVMSKCDAKCIAIAGNKFVNVL